jgi:hypothetical protein
MHFVYTMYLCITEDTYDKQFLITSLRRIQAFLLEALFYVWYGIVWYEPKLYTYTHIQTEIQRQIRQTDRWVGGWVGG